MSNPSETVRPTDAELNILSVLWRRGPSTVRDVQQALDNVRKTGYTTVLKILQIMTDKGLVVRDERSRAHIYRPRYSEDETQRFLVDDLMERAFGGSAMKLVLHSLTSSRASAAELRKIKTLIEEMSDTAGEGGAPADA